MAIPTAPTATTIVTEAYARYGITSPTSAQISRGINLGLENVKDLMCLKSRRWKTLRFKQCQLLAPNMSIQTPYFNEIENIIQINVWEALDPETLFGNALSSLSSYHLNSSETKSRTDFQGKFIASYPQAAETVTSPSGNQLVDLNQCIAYNPTTKVAELIPIAGGYQVPTALSVYRRLSNRYPITIKQMAEYGSEIQFPDVKGRPTQAFIGIYNTTYDGIADTGFGTSEYLVQYDYTADKSYFMEWVCYVDLQLLNLADARYAQILRRWKALFTQGLFVWLLEDNSDDRLGLQATKFGQMLSVLGGQDIDGYDISDIQRTVSD